MFVVKLEVEKLKLDMGRTSNFELISFQNDLDTARNKEFKAEIAYLNLLTLLDQVLGATLDSWHVIIDDRIIKVPKLKSENVPKFYINRA